MITLSDAVAKIEQVLGITPDHYDNDEAVYTINDVFIGTARGAGEHTYAAFRFNNRFHRIDTLHDWHDRYRTRLDDLIKLARRDIDVPAKIDIELFDVVDYHPGGKWDCGHFEFSADTTIGTVSWDEVIPGPRHGEDNHELTIKLNGVELDTELLSLEPLPDFDPPGKPGKWADKFKATIDEDGPELLRDWLDANAAVLMRAAPLT